ncbi:MAG: hypothetical protein ACLSAF_23385 [Intestinimonas sp.]
MTCRLAEPEVTDAQRARSRPALRDLPERLENCGREALGFLAAHPRTVGLMLFNALVGACATLLRFLQDALVRASAPSALLGPLLLLIELGVWLERGWRCRFPGSPTAGPGRSALWG